MRKRFVLSVLAAMVFVLLAVAFSGCVQPPVSGGIFGNAVFTPLVKGCAETDNGMATKGPGDFQEREPTITVDGNSIVYDRAISHLCCRKAEITKEFDVTKVSGGSGNEPTATRPNMITIIESWSGEGCKCMCHSELGASVDNLAQGTYLVRAIEKGTAPDGAPMPERIIIQEIVSVPGQPKQPEETTFVQFQPMQCEGLPWGQSGSEAEIMQFYQQQGVTLLSAQKICPPGIMVCEACGVCPQECYYKAEILEKDKPQMVALGWEELGRV